jgi:hypothetical protein
MAFPLIEIGTTAVVLLGLYAFLCYWEAGRADLAAGFHRAHPGLTRGESPGYRTRARLALVGCGAIALGLIASSL